jgi:hypothetical protein
MKTYLASATFRDKDYSLEIKSHTEQGMYIFFLIEIAKLTGIGITKINEVLIKNGSYKCKEKQEIPLTF